MAKKMAKKKAPKKKRVTVAELSETCDRNRYIIDTLVQRVAAVGRQIGGHVCDEAIPGHGAPAADPANSLVGRFFGTKGAYTGDLERISVVADEPGHAAPMSIVVRVNIPQDGKNAYICREVMKNDLITCSHEITMFDFDLAHGRARQIIGEGADKPAEEPASRFGVGTCWGFEGKWGCEYAKVLSLYEEVPVDDMPRRPVRYILIVKVRLQFKAGAPRRQIHEATIQTMRLVREGIEGSDRPWSSLAEFDSAMEEAQAYLEHQGVEF